MAARKKTGRKSGRRRTARGKPKPPVFEDVNEWATEWKKWGKKVQTEVNKLIHGKLSHIGDPPEPPWDL